LEIFHVACAKISKSKHEALIKMTNYISYQLTAHRCGPWRFGDVFFGHVFLLLVSDPLSPETEVG
jgi:hypothetical protein